MKLRAWSSATSVPLAAALVSLAAVGWAQSTPAPAPGGNSPTARAAQMYTANCASCHGTGAGDGRAPNLFDHRLLEAISDDQLHTTISEGRPHAGMPPFKGVLGNPEIFSLISYIRAQADTLRDRPAFVADPSGQVIKTENQAFRIDVVASGLETPWGFALLPDNGFLVTERPGRLRIIRNGQLLPEPVSGTPAVMARQDGGMLDVALHPDYAGNGWIYLSYTEMLPGATIPPPPPEGSGLRPTNPPMMTVIVRGRINANNQWVDNQEIFRSAPSLYTPSGSHFGSRFFFDKQGHLFYTLGDRGDMTHAQNLASPLGKIHRINADGSVPADNPFVNVPGAVPTIWSFGHRNPQGLAEDPVTGLLWESEHGPFGGDEINIITKGQNYGWGLVSMGTQPGITERSSPGMEDPIVYYTPAMGPSGIAFLTSDRYPAWKDSLFVAALAGQQLRRLQVDSRAVLSQSVVFEQFGRTRAVAQGSDGLLYALLQNPTGRTTGLSLSASTPGILVRLTPVDCAAMPVAGC